ncbi:TetR/AcrR family transcriptional regulator [Lentzea sp. NPDC005914]|uniref:TetR/AcrR family transcriptional regulator n=1 Tax=Lentzea sp. NPDC005914 TaxID=3154572 RepID=UPI0033DB0310
MRGVNEGKKQRTRARIAAAAVRLFTEHGFENVTVARIAAAAEVSNKTVYNYFPTKAHLVFDEHETAFESLVAAIRDRAPGRSALTAVCRVRAEHHPARVLDRVVEDSDSLRNHQLAMAARYEHALADVLAEQTGAPAGSAEPFVAAVALIGALRAGWETAGLDDALDLLEHGFAGYAVRSPAPSAADSGAPDGTKGGTRLSDRWSRSARSDANIHNPSPRSASTGG